MDRFTGGCLCGNVRFWRRAPIPGRPCHCLDCRKHHGALFHASAVFPRCGDYRRRNTRLRRAVFLSPMRLVVSRSADEIEVNLGSLDDPDQLTHLRTLDRPSRVLVAAVSLTRRYERERDVPGRFEGRSEDPRTTTQA
jgi:hypothetical protein